MYKSHYVKTKKKQKSVSRKKASRSRSKSVNRSARSRCSPKLKQNRQIKHNDSLKILAKSIAKNKGSGLGIRSSQTGISKVLKKMNTVSINFGSKLEEKSSLRKIKKRNLVKIKKNRMIGRSPDFKESRAISTIRGIPDPEISKRERGKRKRQPKLKNSFQRTDLLKSKIQNLKKEKFVSGKLKKKKLKQSEFSKSTKLRFKRGEFRTRRKKKDAKSFKVISINSHQSNNLPILSAHRKKKVLVKGNSFRNSKFEIQMKPPNERFADLSSLNLMRGKSRKGKGGKSKSRKRRKKKRE